MRHFSVVLFLSDVHSCLCRAVTSSLEKKFTSQDLSRHIKEHQNCIYSLNFEIKLAKILKLWLCFIS